MVEISTQRQIEMAGSPPRERLIARFMGRRRVGQIANVTRTDGGRLSLALYALRWCLVKSPLLTQRVAARVVKSRLARLPAFTASYPDGRRFRVAAGDLAYPYLFGGEEYEPHVTAVVRGLLRPGDFAIDVGANYGWFTLVMGHRVGIDGCVWGLEPLPPTFLGLQANVDANPDLPIRTFQLATGAHNREMDIHLFAGLSHGHASASTLGRTDFTTYRVKARTLDSLIEDAEGLLPTLIKLDAEGSELATLHGARRLIGSSRPPIWIIEVNYSTAAACRFRPTDVMEFLQATGDYQIYRIIEGGLVLEMDPARAPDGAMWACIPATYDGRLNAMS
jgi:FkbM family methyltransferase